MVLDRYLRATGTGAAVGGIGNVGIGLARDERPSSIAGRAGRGLAQGAGGGFGLQAGADIDNYLLRSGYDPSLLRRFALQLGGLGLGAFGAGKALDMFTGQKRASEKKAFTPSGAAEKTAAESALRAAAVVPMALGAGAGTGSLINLLRGKSVGEGAAGGAGAAGGGVVGAGAGSLLGLLGGAAAGRLFGRSPAAVINSLAIGGGLGTLAGAGGGAVAGGIGGSRLYRALRNALGGAAEKTAAASALRSAIRTHGGGLLRRLRGAATASNAASIGRWAGGGALAGGIHGGLSEDGSVLGGAARGGLYGGAARGGYLGARELVNPRALYRVTRGAGQTSASPANYAARLRNEMMQGRIGIDKMYSDIESSRNLAGLGGSVAGLLGARSLLGSSGGDKTASEVVRAEKHYRNLQKLAATISELPPKLTAQFGQDGRMGPKIREFIRNARAAGDTVNMSGISAQMSRGVPQAPGSLLSRIMGFGRRGASRLVDFAVRHPAGVTLTSMAPALILTGLLIQHDKRKRKSPDHKPETGERSPR